MHTSTFMKLLKLEHRLSLLLLSDQQTRAYPLPPFLPKISHVENIDQIDTLLSAAISCLDQI